MIRLVRFLVAPAMCILGCTAQVPKPPGSEQPGVCTIDSRPFVLVNDDDNSNVQPGVPGVGTPDADLLEIHLVDAFDVVGASDLATYLVRWQPETRIRVWADANRTTELVNGKEAAWPADAPTIWVEGLESGPVGLTLTTLGATSGEVSHQIEVDVIDVDILRYDGTEAGMIVSVYRPRPIIKIPDITPGQIVGNRFVIPKANSVASDVVTFVTRVEYFNSDEADVGWREIAVNDGPAPSEFGKPYESTFASSFVLAGLDDLRRRPLGSRRRYLFRATNAVGRSAYDELILEVRLDAETDDRILEPINLLTTPDEPDPIVPAHVIHRLDLKPTSVMDKATLYLNEGSLFYSAVSPDGTSAIQGGDLRAPISFVVLDDGDLVLRTGNPQRRFIPHFRRHADDPAIRATIGSAETPTCDRRAIEAVGTEYGLSVALTDDHIEDIVPITVRYVGQAGTVTQESFVRHSLLMRPFRLTLPDAPEQAATQIGTVLRLDWDGPPGSMRAWSNPMEANSEWRPLDLPADFAIGAIEPAGATVTLQSLSNRRFLIEGNEEDEAAFLALTVTDGDTLIAEDRVQLLVRNVKGVAGQRLERFPLIQYTQTFNEQNDAGIADTVSVALDPSMWPHITARYSLRSSSAANVQVVPHRTPEEWVSDNSLMGPAARLVRFDGRSMTSSIQDIGQVSEAGAYDVVLDLMNAAGNPVPNGRFDPGDIIGVLTDEERIAEIQIVADPLGPVVFTPHVGWLEYGSVNRSADRFTIPANTDENPSGVADNYIHGLIYYPAANESGPGVTGAEGQFPLVVLLHGNHAPLRWLDGLVQSNALTAEQAEAITGAENYEGFVYLQQYLATKGYISVSVDLDRYFGSTPPFDWPGEGIRARAFCAIMNIDRVRTLNAPQSGSVIANRIDFEDITLLGHSKGGESVVECCEYRGSNDNPSPSGPFAQAAPFPITRVISVAPARKHEGTVGDRSHLILHGAADGDEWPATGFRHYDDASGRKALLFIDGANHNFFNASWPYSDATQKPNNDTGDIDPMTPPVGDPATLTMRGYQEDLLKAYVYAWLQDDRYLAYFSRAPERIRPPALAPRSIHQQYQDWPANRTVWDDFESGDTLEISSSGGTALAAGLDILEERELSDAVDHYYNVTRAVELSWDLAGGHAIYAQFPPTPSADVSATRYLSFRAGPHYEESAPLAFTVELRDAAGGVAYMDTASLSLIGVPYNATGVDLPAPLFAPADMTRTMFRTFRLDLQALQNNGRRLDLTQLTSVRFIFDQATAAGVRGRLVIDDIEFTD